MTISRELVRFSRRKSESIPAEILAKARLHVLDNLGIAAAAGGCSVVGGQVRSASNAGAASGSCTVIGQRGQLPPMLAAFVNSSLAHTMDYDDIHDVARIHPTSVTLPAALAAAELGGADGAAVLRGCIVGNEVLCRMGKTITPLGKGPGAHWFLTQLFGYLGATISAGLVLDLSEDELTAAVGLAYMQLAGGKEVAMGVGATSRSIYTGFAAQGGVQSVLLARAGLIGPPGALDGVAGMFPLYLGVEPEPAEVETLLDPDGWAWEDVAFKPWPCCRSSHPYVSVALDLRNRVKAADVERLSVAINARAGLLCAPLEERRRPTTLADAKYSIPYMVAFALAKGEVTLANLGEAAVRDPEVLGVAQKVDIVESLADLPGPAPAEITASLVDGRTEFARLENGIGLDTDQVRAKFIDCLRSAGSGDRAGDVWDDLLADVDSMTAADILRTLNDSIEPA